MSKRGAAALQTSWLMHEYTTLLELHTRGGDVPRPIEYGDNALLMEFIGDEHGPAPTLNDVDVPEEQAQQLFEREFVTVVAARVSEHFYKHDAHSAFAIDALANH